ncbi:hypothetical protein GCM10010371_15550 [Streptomyces subrutilus]|uniref:Uncharacterized protein n=1 Tax=Streptomyces subrutilus TaxID=36818 RepID=A0A5P2UHX0_9ACTN|nr:hypothetical protein CP968_06690 [Streptomyces subrutilus]GGZ56881.1 hypothetical protein GCM10010371_15550 [Streptomyces subrutilus]
MERDGLGSPADRTVRRTAGRGPAPRAPYPDRTVRRTAGPRSAPRAPYAVAGSGPRGGLR